MASERDYDVIIIGTGAGGGTLAHALAPSGQRILLIERGDFLPREKENWDTNAVFVQGRYKSHETWRDRDGKPFSPSIHYWVGGNTKFYGAALVRFREQDFGEVRHHGGLSPAWPITYADLEPYYTRAEHLYQVHGERGADPTEPPASAPYRFPAVSHEPRVQHLYDDLKQMGLHPFHLPVGIMLDEANPHRSRCIRCDTCDGFACLVQAKADAHVIAVEPALTYPNVEIVTRAFARRIETSPSGREATGVVVERDGAVETYRAGIVVAACGAINTAALLLRSAGERHPNGLANRSGVVGRHYMCHNNSALVALSREPNPTRFQKTLGLNDFYWGTDDWEYPLGHISMLGKSKAEMFKGDAPFFTPGLALEQMARHALDLWLTTEDLPDPDNRVTLDRDGTIRLSYRENNNESHRRLIAKLKGLLSHLGCEEHVHHQSVYLGKKIPLAGTAHQCGTVRMGHDPATSALDPNCRAHEVDNLYVVDSSCFVSSTSLNPALTIMANALRVGDHLLERLGVSIPTPVAVPAD